jgi:hypothetical protein
VVVEAVAQDQRAEMAMKSADPAELELFPQ